MSAYNAKRALRSKAVWFSLLVMLAFSLVAVLTPWIAPHDPYKFGVTVGSLPPMWVQNTSRPGQVEYPLGTDRYGRDVLSRLLYGTRTAFFLALAAVPLSALLGTLFGLAAGYAGGKLDSAMMILADIIQSLPGIMFMVLIVLIFRTRLTPTWFHGLLTLVIGFAAVSWVSLARLVRISVMQIKSGLFVEAAVSLGGTPAHIIWKHLLPNVMHIILVWGINNIPAVILLEAVLGYIGIGVTWATDGSEFTVASWGGLFYSGRSALNSNPLMLALPSICILLISMSFILLADYWRGLSRPEES